MPLRILLVDDHTMLRAGIRAILERNSEFTVVGEAADGAEAIDACQHNIPDIMVMDIGLPDMNGIEATQVILRHAPGLKVVVLSIYDDEQTVVNAIRTGAQAFVLKSASGTDLLEALRTVANGGFYLSPQLSDHLLEGITRDSGRSSLASWPRVVLAPRELQVFRLVATGKGSKDIAAILELTLGTVRTYRKTMMRKLGVNNVAGLTRMAIASGVTIPNPSFDERTSPFPDTAQSVSHVDAKLIDDPSLVL